MEENDYDLAVIGSGPGGYVAAIRAAQLGLRTVLAETSELGGICLNWGCIPTKALLRSADVLRLVQEAGRYGVRAGAPQADLHAMVSRSREVAQRLQHGVGHLLKKNGITVLHARARLAGRGAIRLEAAGSGPVPDRIRAKDVILATGARARVLQGLPADPDGVWYYREALAPGFLPRRMIVIGAGAIGIEFASFYHALGVQVQVVEQAAAVLPAEDADVSDCVARALTRQGMTLRLGAAIESTTRVDGTWRVHLQGQKTPCEADVLLVAAGIQGNVDDLGLEHTAVEVKDGHIVTGAFGATHEPGIHAIGDVAGAPWLAHKAMYEAVICAEKIAGMAPRPLVTERIPACTYSHPQVARVGLTEAQARNTGRDVRIGRFPLQANGKAIALGDTEGFVKVIHCARSGELLGAHMVGPDVTEMIHGYGIAMGLETTEAELMQTVFPHPTQSEAMYEAVLSAYDRVLHI